MNNEHIPRIIQFHRLQYSLDVLTDGSDHTGNGTIFLTVCTKTNVKINDKDDRDVVDQSNIQARYALSGLSTLCSRLCADQNLKLSNLRAVFCSSRIDVNDTAGIPSTLLALSNYSITGTLCVVGPEGIDDYMEEMRTIILGRRDYPIVSTCVVPPLSSDQNGDISLAWWKLFEDEYIVVHGRNLAYEKGSSPSISTTLLDQSIVYIVTLLGSEDKTQTSLKYSFAVVPSRIDTKTSKNILYPLPEFVMPGGISSIRPAVKPLKFILYIHPRIDPIEVSDKESSSDYNYELHPYLRSISSHHLLTMPNNDENTYDDGILIRAMDQAKLLHSSIPFAFPVSPKSSQNSLPENTTCGKKDKLLKLGPFIKLQSCTTILLRSTYECSGGVTSEGTDFELLDRKQKIHTKILHSKHSDAIVNNAKFDSMYEELRNIFRIKDCQQDVDVLSVDNPIVDENEINLGSSTSASDDELSISYQGGDVPEYDSHSSHLLVLGTGCASPSPLRGASGYVLLLPSMSCSTSIISEIKNISDEKVWNRHLTCSIVFECGEGFLNSLSRCIPHYCRGKTDSKMYASRIQRNISEILLIWISHAHLDHYGELPVLIHEINCTKSNYQPWCQCWDAPSQARQSRFHQTKTKKDIYSTCNINGQQSVRPRCLKCSSPIPPIVVAPMKVLRFLDCALNCKNGIRVECEDRIIEKDRMYLGITNRDFDTSPFGQDIRNTVFGYELYADSSAHVCDYDIPRHASFSAELKKYRPLKALHSVPVDHCPNAFGLFLHLNRNHEVRYNDIFCSGRQSKNLPLSPISDFTLCYSGDTRPCQNIINRCREEQLRRGVKVSLLIHEATFHHDDQGKREAIKKSHSTIEEAIGVASQINYGACLLTHFSQRYGRTIFDSECDGGIGAAFDGLLLPLNSILEISLPLISQCANYVIQNTYKTQVK